MNAIKTELEELSFKVLYPKIYNEIVMLVAHPATTKGPMPRSARICATAIGWMMYGSPAGTASRSS